MFDQCKYVSGLVSSLVSRSETLALPHFTNCSRQCCHDLWMTSYMQHTAICIPTAWAHLAWIRHTYSIVLVAARGEALCEAVGLAAGASAAIHGILLSALFA